MFAKRLADLTSTDAARIWDEQWQESNALELKSQIPTNDGRPDRWESTGDRIGDYGKQKILREIVAFANAYGGTLVIGVEETTEKPARAASLFPIAKCVDLAERFRRIIREEVEPRLLMVECEGIPLKGTSGIVVIRVPSSVLGPHWVRSTRDPTFRRADESVTMTMHEIQDLTIRLSRAADERLAVFNNVRNDFSAECESSVPGYYSAQRALHEQMGKSGDIGCVGVRCTAIPLVPFMIDRVATRREAHAINFPQLIIQQSDGKTKDVSPPSRWDTADWRPEFRAARTESHDKLGRFSRSIDWRGKIEVRWIQGISILYLDWLMCTVAMILNHVDQIREAESAIDVPFAMDVQIRRFGEVSPSWNDFASSRTLPPDINLPTIEIGDAQTFRHIFRSIQYDCWTASGHNRPPILEVTIV